MLAVLCVLFLLMRLDMDAEILDELETLLRKFLNITINAFAITPSSEELSYTSLT